MEKKKRSRPRKPRISAESISDGSSASYYELPSRAKELQDLISHKNMNAQIGEIFRSCYRYGAASHSNELRDAKKIKFSVCKENINCHIKDVSGIKEIVKSCF